MSETIISGRYYKEASAFVSNEAWGNRSIRIEPHPEGGAVVLATDGHTLCVFRDKLATCSEPVTVAFRKEILPLLVAPKTPKPSFDLRAVRVNGEVEVVEAKPDYKANNYAIGKTVVRFFGDVLTDAKFPNWRAVMPKETPPLRSDFNADYLVRCARGDRGIDRGVTIWHDEKCEKPAIVRSANRDDFVAIVMPMRGSDHPAYPAYMQPLLEPKAEPKPEVATAKASGNKKQAA